MADANGAIAPMPAEVEALAGTIIAAGMKVHKVVGPGLLESVYEQCLACELTERGHVVKRQVPVALKYGKFVLESACRIDMVVDNFGHRGSEGCRGDKRRASSAVAYVLEAARSKVGICSQLQRRIV